MSRLIRLSALQLGARPAGSSFAARQAANRTQVEALLAVAGKRGSDLVLLGEYANLSHRGASRKKSEWPAEPVPGPFTRIAARYARRYKMNIALPLFAKLGEGVVSCVVFIDRSGEISGIYRKTHPTVAEQRRGILPGDSLAVVALDCCTVGTMVCMDIEYPETAQVLMLRGAELLLFPHVQAGWGEPDWEVRYRARAIDTGLPLLSASYGYEEGAWKPGSIIGRSGIVGRDGLILADAGRGIEVVTLDIDIAQGRVTHFFFERKHERTAAVKASRRPELYGDLTDGTKPSQG